MGRILAIRGGAVGDFILTLPAIHLLKTGLPDAHVEVLGYEGVASLAVKGGMADGTRSIERGSMAGFFVPGAKLDPELKAWFGSFDLVVSWLYDPDGYLAGNLERSGVKTLLQGPHRMEESGDIPAAIQLAKPLEQIALYLEEPHVSLGLNREPGPWIAIHPGSGSPSKNWGFENWAETARRLAEVRPGYRFLVISGEAEAENIGEFLQLMRDAGVDFEHLEGAALTEVADRLASCRLFLGHDSGISHLAGATGIPAEIIFGRTRPEIWAPRNPGVRVISSPDGELSRLKPEFVTSRAVERLPDA